MGQNDNGTKRSMKNKKQQYHQNQKTDKTTKITDNLQKIRENTKR